jgi:SAM-dependent methyltransferase
MKGDWLAKFRETGSVVFSIETYQHCVQMMERVLPLYQKHLPEGSRIIEVGCGLGCTAIPLSQHYAVTALDKDDRILEYARQNAKAFGGDITFKKGDIRELAGLYPQDSFDAVTSDGVMEHFPEEDVKTLLEQQLRIAPLVFIHVPLGNQGRVSAGHGIERYLWTESHWLNSILSKYLIIDRKLRKTGAKGVTNELSVVIKRGER